MRYFRIATIAVCALGLSGCFRSQEPLNPPQLTTVRDTDMSIQLFMQATLLLGSYHGFSTLEYSALRDASARNGFEVLPFMLPISDTAAPALAKVKFEIPLDPDGRQIVGEAFRNWGRKTIGKRFHAKLLTYYVQTGWRAAQLVCRNYLVGLDERNSYWEFLKREFNIGSTLANASLIAAGANVTLRAIGVATQWTGNELIDSYRDFRYLTIIDRDAARALVEAAQNQYALDFIGRLSKKEIIPAPADTKSLFDSPELVLFADAVHVLNTIEYQCTRSGIRGLLHKAVRQAPPKMVLDPISNAIEFQ
jgi:hypothetical protein